MTAGSRSRRVASWFVLARRARPGSREEKMEFVASEPWVGGFWAGGAARAFVI